MLTELGTMVLLSIVTTPLATIFLVVRLDNWACTFTQIQQQPSNMVIALRRNTQFYAMITIDLR